MTMIKDLSKDETDHRFWLNYPDQTQAAVHLALQWLAYVYPTSESQIEATLKHAQPYADSDLSSRWSQFLEGYDVEEHVDALQWIRKTFSCEQIPFLVETCWRLLLVDHELPSHVPLALRILGRVLDVDEATMLSLGESVLREYVDEDQTHSRAPLLPIDPRYLDRVEWRLLGHNSTQRLNVSAFARQEPKNYSGLAGFVLGTFFGVGVMAFLVFGPLHLGRVKVPILMHDIMMNEPESTAAPVASSDTYSNPVSVPASDVEAAPGIEPSAEIETSDSHATVSEQAELSSQPEAVVVEPDVDAVSVTSPSNETDASSGRILMAVSASILNVRGQPSVNGDVLMKLGEGAQVWAYPDEAEGLWMLVQVDGAIGYVSARFLTEVP
ncbi:MAG: hypothetical protein P8X89_05660 [Reinekea sp.]